ncbi:MAG: LUD domain-containing protein [Frisingicoccus sp.]
MKLLETLIKNLDKRSMEAYYVDNGEEALKMALRFVTPGSSVSWGGSMSINEIGLIPALKASDCVVLDRICQRRMKRKRIFQQSCCL